MQQIREVSRTRTIGSTETHTSDFILIRSEMGSQCSFFPGEVLSGGDGVPRKQGFPSVCRRLFLPCVLMALTVVVHLFVADSSLLDCCDLVVFLPPYVCR